MFSTAKKVIRKVLSFSHTPPIDQNAYQYNQLTPIDNANIQEYENALYQALKNDKVKNIALTGSYGSGKSSVLRTFEKKYKNSEKFKFLNISLATFNVEYKALSENNEHNRIQINNSIEKSLLQQIIFKVRSEELEDSNFSRIKIKNIWSNFGIAFLVMAWMILTYFIFKPEYKLFKDNILFNKDYLVIYQGFVVFISICLMQHVLNLLPRLRLNKLGIASAEISFNENKGDSVLNKYLDELIYFFCKTKFNVLIIEDLDRFRNIEIFVNLRELNILLNNSDEIIKRKKQIKFVYALGDNVFESIDKTKFFDFIIPIIPVVNSTNAAEILRSEIKKAFKNHKIPNDFFNEVTLYIDDMRLILNITNEFVIYKKKLAEISKIQLKDEKLLGLIIYKNKYPHDFVELNYRRGVIAQAFSNRSDFQKLVIDKLEQEISQLEEELNEIEAENIRSIEDLIKVYLFTITNQMQGAIMLHLASTGSYLPIVNFVDENIFESLRNQSSITYRLQNGGTQSITNNFSQTEKSVDANLSFSKRKENIKKRNEG